MPEEQARSPLRGCGGGENQAEEPTKTVYFVPIYAVAVVDPNKHIGKSRLPLDDQRQWNVGSSENVSGSQRGLGGKAAEPEVAVEQKRQKLIVMRRRGRVPEYDDDDPHKPTPKRLRNRMKAQKSRDKKKAYINSLESKVMELGKMNSELEERCLSLQIENEALKNEVLESDPGAKEEMMHYFEKLEEDKENKLERSTAENQGGTPGPRKSAANQAGTQQKCTEISDDEVAPETELDEEGAPETALYDQECVMECAEISKEQCRDNRFVEADDRDNRVGKYAEVSDREVASGKTVEVGAQEQNYAGGNAEAVAMTWTDFENSAISYLVDGVEQDSILQ